MPNILSSYLFPYLFLFFFLSPSLLYFSPFSSSYHFYFSINKSLSLSLYLSLLMKSTCIYYFFNKSKTFYIFFFYNRSMAVIYTNYIFYFLIFLFNQTKTFFISPLFHSLNQMQMRENKISSIFPISWNLYFCGWTVLNCEYFLDGKLEIITHVFIFSTHFEVFFFLRK